MKYLTLALAAAGLVLQTTGAFAISFAPLKPLAVPEGEAAASKWTVGLSASSWDLPAMTNVIAAGDKLAFDSQVRPLLTVEYQAAEKLTVGGWYNAIAWDLNYTSGGVTTKVANVDGGIFELHGTYDTPWQGVQAQLGYQRLSADVKVGGQKATVESNLATLWALKTFDLQKAAKGNLGALAGLGVQQGLDKDSGSLGGNALVGLSYGFSKNYSADASVWFNDFTRSDSSVTRFTFGVTGRF